MQAAVIEQQKPEDDIQATATEAEVVEGEIVAEAAAPVQAKRKPYWLLPVMTGVICSLLIAAQIMHVTVLNANPFAPKTQLLTIIMTIKLQGRQLPSLTLSQTAITPTTGHVHQSAKRATGSVTFFNGQISSQFVKGGTALTDVHGIQVVTDYGISVPAGSPPNYGQATVSAHALRSGLQGNIAAHSIDNVFGGMFAKNTIAFHSGVAARDYVVVTKSDVDSIATSLFVTLNQSGIAALRAQLAKDENMIALSCIHHVSSSHKIGDEAKSVSVAAFATCHSLAYNSQALYAVAKQVLSMQHTLSSNVSLSVLNAHVSSNSTIAFLVHAYASFVY